MLLQVSCFQAHLLFRLVFSLIFLFPVHRKMSSVWVKFLPFVVFNGETTGASPWNIHPHATMPPLKIEGNQGGLQKDLVIFETCSSCLFRGFGGMLPQLHLLPSTCAAVPDYPIRLSLSLCESSLSRFNLWNLSLLLCWNVSRNRVYVCVFLTENEPFFSFLILGYLKGNICQ